MFEKVKFNKNFKMFSESILDENIETNMPITKNINFNKNIHMKKFGHILILGDERTKYEYVKQNILKKNTNYIVVDKCGILYEALNQEMKSANYNIQTIDLINFNKNYNPFLYILDNIDVLKITETILKEEKNKYIFDKSMFSLMNSLMFYIYYCCDKSEQNFTKLIELLENYDEYKKIIKKLEMENQDDIIVKQFKYFCMLDEKSREKVKDYTLKRLKEIFTKEVLSMMSNANIDENIDLSFEEKTIVFIKIPKQNDNVVLAMIMEQIINYITKKSISLMGHRFKEPVRIFFDGFDCAKYFTETHIKMFITGMYGILYSILVNDIDELKNVYKKDINIALNNTNILIANSKEEDLKYIIDYWKNDTSIFKIKDNNKAINLKKERMIDLDFITLSPDDSVLFVKGSYIVIDEKL